MRNFSLSFCCIFILALTINVNAGNLPKIAKIKAAYIFNFPAYITWPAHILSKDTPFFSICYSGPDNHLIKAVKNLTGKIKQQYPIKIKVYDPHLENQCHILIITGIDNQYTQLLQSVSTQKVLTISDITEFSHREDGVNGHVELIKKANRVRFIINKKSLMISGLRVSAKLLKLAIIVDDEGVMSEYADNGVVNP